MAFNDDPNGLGQLGMGVRNMTDPEQPLRQPPANAPISQPQAQPPETPPASNVPSPQEYMGKFLEGVPYKRISSNGNRIYDSQILHDATVAGLKSWSDLHDKERPDPYKALLGDYYKAKTEELRKSIKDGPQTDPQKQLEMEKLRLQIEQIKNPPKEPVEPQSVEERLKIHQQMLEDKTAELDHFRETDPQYLKAVADKDPEMAGNIMDSQRRRLDKLMQKKYGPLLEQQTPQPLVPAPAPVAAPAVAPAAAPAAASTPVAPVAPQAPISTAAPQSLAERVRAAAALDASRKGRR